MFVARFKAISGGQGRRVTEADSRPLQNASVINGFMLDPL